MNLMKRRNNRYEVPAEVDRLRNEINRIFDDDWFGGRGLLDRTFAPSMDIEDSGDEVLVTAELPGIDIKDVDVSVSGNVLTVKGEKKDEHEDRDGGYYHRERWSGSFQRSVTLPDAVDAENVKAEMKSGILRITFPKREEVKPKQISVKSA
ncbi:MAG: Hsp20 family protein [Spirochaetes bacterium]|jgi:HSP20 family protein|nr:Hsp20 family protein [Spirochaetota bacterium]